MYELVAGVEERCEEGEETSLGATGYRDLFGRWAMSFAFVVRGEGLAELGQTGVRRISEMPRSRRIGKGVGELGRRGETGRRLFSSTGC